VNGRARLLVIALLPAMLACLWAADSQAGSLKTMSAKLIARPASHPVVDVHEKWAVVVGLEEFQDPAIQPQRLAERSAVGLQKVLTDPNSGRFAADHVYFLKGSQATKSAIVDGVARSWLLKKALPRDLVILYFCSRAVPSKDGKEIYLCAYDTLASEAELSGIPLRELLTELKHRSQSKLMFCFLDTAAVGYVGGKSDLAAFSKATGVSVLSANVPGEELVEATEADGTCFSHYLCEALKAGNGSLPLQAISDYVKEHVQEASSKTPGYEEKPVLAVAPDEKDLLAVAPGVTVKSSLPPKKLSIGHPVDNLMWSRPELSGPRTHAGRAETAGKDDDEQDADADSKLDFGPYMTKMKHDIQDKWHPPKGLENRHVVVTFAISRDGTILSPQIVESGGAEATDRAALDALKAASPLDPLPPAAPRSVQIKYQFDWHVNPAK